jgi:biotin biosynthesis protein BioC
MSTIVLLHGWGSDSRCWDLLLGLLPAEHQYLPIDLPGFGSNSQVQCADIETLLAWLIHQIPPDSTLIGWSLGGTLATALASRHPEKVGRLITLATNPNFVALPASLENSETDAGINSVIDEKSISLSELDSKVWPHGMAANVYQQFCSDFFRHASATLKKFVVLQAMNDAESKWVARELQAASVAPEGSQKQQWEFSLSLLSDIDNRHNLRLMAQPALHILGAGDTLVPASVAEHIAQLNPQHEVVILENTAHAAHISQPQQVAKLIEKFLTTAEPVCSKRKRRIANSFSGAARNYDRLARLQKRVADSLLSFTLGDRLVESGSLLDIGCGTGYCTQKLLELEQLSSAELHGLDLAEGMLIEAQSKFSELGLDGRVAWHLGDMEALPFAAETFSGIVSSLSVQWAESPERLFCEAARVLKSGGWFSFSTLGPETLFELKSAWQAVDSRAHVNQFLPLDRLKDEAKAAGFDIVAHKVELPLLYYHNLTELLRELKGIGAHTINSGRMPGLMGRKAFLALQAQYHSTWMNPDKGLPARYEVYYLFCRKR